jgi:heme d1 biosynthesis radical SAM protein NirJ
MFRVTQYLKELESPTPLGPKREPKAPVVIWNLIRRCNLTCAHCYSGSTNVDFPGELSTAEVCRTMDDLAGFGVPVLILSGGEPLMRRDIFEVSERAKAMGFYVGLSSNGTLIDAATADRIAEVGYNYVGISLDGIGATHDRFRGEPGSFDAALAGVRRCVARGIKVGLRMTITADTAHELPDILELMAAEGVDKLYVSHLNYGGRGNVNRGRDAHFRMTREAMDRIFAAARDSVRRDAAPKEFVTGNNDADGAYLLLWAAERYPRATVEHLRAKLEQWGGNASGRNVANIDNLGNVHPDTFWWHYTLGNVRRRPFSEIWPDTSDPLMAGLKRHPRPVTGRCADCRFLALCNGNTRVRAEQITGDPWAEDPGCYLDDREIGVADGSRTVPMAPYLGKRTYVAADG